MTTANYECAPGKLAAMDSDDAQIARGRHPGYGWCLRCGYTHHERKFERATIMIDANSGAVICCDQCWGEIGVDERIECARALYRSWQTDYLGRAFQPGLTFDENAPEWVQLVHNIRVRSRQESAI